MFLKLGIPIFEYIYFLVDLIGLEAVGTFIYKSIFGLQKFHMAKHSLNLFFSCSVEFWFPGNLKLETTLIALYILIKP